MAIASKGACGATANSSSNSSFTHTTATTAVSIGDILLVQVAINTSTASIVESITDTLGNTYTLLKDVVGTSAYEAVFMCRAARAIAVGTVLTIKLTAAATHKEVHAWAFTVASGATLIQSAAAQSITQTAAVGFGSQSFAGLASKSRLYYMAGAKQASSTTAITASTSFTSEAWADRSANNASAIVGRAEFRINTSTGETSNPTMAVSGNTAAVFLALEEFTYSPAADPTSYLGYYPDTIDVWAKHKMLHDRQRRQSIAQKYDVFDFAPIIPFDPTGFAASFYLRADPAVPEFNGLPWTGLATPGVSSGRNGVAVVGNTDPTTGTTANGYTPANFVTAGHVGFRCGATQIVTDLFFYDGVSNGPTHGQGVVVMRYTGSGNVFRDDFFAFQLSIDSVNRKVTFQLTDDQTVTPNTFTTASNFLPPAGTIFALWFKFDYSTIPGTFAVAVDTGSYTSANAANTLATVVHSGSPLYMGDAVQSGGTAGSGAFAGDIFETQFLKTTYSSTDRSNFYAYYQARYVAAALTPLDWNMTPKEEAWALQRQLIERRSLVARAPNFAFTQLVTAALNNPGWRNGWENDGFNVSSLSVVTTPVAGDLFVVHVAEDSVTTLNPPTDDNGGTYTQLQAASSLSGRGYTFIRDQALPNNTTTTVTITTLSGLTPLIMRVEAFQGFSKYGTAAVVQSNVATGTSGVTPSVAFSSNAQPANITLAHYWSSTTSTAPISPTGWTERAEVNPTPLLESVTRDSGFASTTLTWGHTSSAGWGAIVVELDASVPLPSATYPRRIERPTFRVDRQQAAANVLGLSFYNPAVDAGERATFPERVTRPIFRPEQQRDLSRTVVEQPLPMADTEMPVRVERPTFAARMQLAVTSIATAPERTLPSFYTEYPNVLFRVLTHASRVPFVAFFAPAPEQKIPEPSVTSPDRIVRPMFHASQQLHDPPFNHAPERTLPSFDTEYPDVLFRVLAHARAMPFLAAPAAQPEEKIQLDWVPSFPERIVRAQTPANAHLFATPAAKPEAPVPEVLAFMPDAVRRPMFAVTLQMTGAVNLVPERAAALADVEWPDRIVRPFFHVRLQLHVTQLAPVPERTTPLADVNAPDRVTRSIFHASQQLPATSAPPAPERTTPLAMVEAPHRVDRPMMHARHQLDSVLPPLTVAFVRVDWLASYVDRVSRPQTPANAHLFTTPVNAPEAPVPEALSYQPDRVPRPTFPTTRQMPFAAPVRPEETVQLDWSPIYPDRATRTRTPVNAHLFATPATVPEATVPEAFVYAPDRVLRPTFGVSLQRDHFWVQPEERLPHDWSVEAPVAVVRPAPRAVDQMAHATAVQPERTTPLAVVEAPARVERPIFHARHQLATTQLQSAPERTLPSFDVSFPERVVRPFYPASRQRADFYVTPEEKAPHDWSVEYPGAVVRAFPRAVDQRASFFDPFPIPDPALKNMWIGYQPERVTRPAFAPSAQQALAFWPFPLPASALTLLNTDWVVTPDAVTRPTFAPVRQLHVTHIAPAPEQKAPLAAVEAPSRVLRPTFGVQLQLPATSEPPRPERTTPLADVSAPERIVRPFYPVTSQVAPAPEPVQPERRAQLADVSAPDRISRPTFHASRQQASNVVEPQPERVEFFDVVAPSRVDRPMPHSRHLPPHALGPQPERVEFFDAVFPLRVPLPPRTTQLSTETGVLPFREVPVPFFDAVGPARVERVFVRAVDHPSSFYVRVPPPPVSAALDWLPTYPHHVERPYVIPAHVLAHAFLAIIFPPPPIIPHGAAMLSSNEQGVARASESDERTTAGVRVAVDRPGAAGAGKERQGAGGAGTSRPGAAGTSKSRKGAGKL